MLMIRRSLRSYATKTVHRDPYLTKVDKSRFDCIEQLKKVDPSTLLISKFYPQYLQDSFIAIKSFNIELSKVSFGYQPGATDKSKQFNNLKFGFWQQQIEKLDGLDLVNANERILGINEPATMLLADTALKGLQFDTGMLNQMIASHQHFYNSNSTSGFRSLNDICSFGEGTHSQMNYLMQSILLSPQLTGFSDQAISKLESSNNELRNNLSDISGHLGQATSICSFLIGLKYFAEKKNILMLPSDTLLKHNLSEEGAIRLILGTESDPNSKELLKNVIFDVATLANDHIITAKSKLDQIKNEWGSKLPECIYLPFMNGLPSILYLERLEKCDFDVLHQKLQTKEWRLAWRSWWGHRNRSL